MFKVLWRMCVTVQLGRCNSHTVEIINPMNDFSSIPQPYFHPVKVISYFKAKSMDVINRKNLFLQT